MGVNFYLSKIGGEENEQPVIVVHGGAGNWHPERINPGLEGVKKVAKTGFDIMAKGGSALYAVVEAVSVMEDEGVFNAGYGQAYP
jgi:Asparaginase